jgi:hypothetical protein
MNYSYSKEHIHYLNTQHGGGWIRMPEKDNSKEYVLYATGESNISSGRVYVALKPGPLSYEDKVKYNIM